jgi:hypothetical protein
MTDFPTKLVLPSKRLLEGCSYRPSWMYSPPKVRGFIPTLNGRFGLSKPKVPEGTACERNLDEALNPSTAG